MKKSFKKAIAVLLAVLMVAFSVPFTAFAAPGDYNPDVDVMFGTFHHAEASSWTDYSTSSGKDYSMCGLYDVPVDFNATLTNGGLTKSGTLYIDKDKANKANEVMGYDDLTEDYVLGVGDYFTCSVIVKNISKVSAMQAYVQYSDNIEPAGYYSYKSGRNTAYTVGTVSECAAANGTFSFGGSTPIADMSSYGIYEGLNDGAIGNMSSIKNDADTNENYMQCMESCQNGAVNYIDVSSAYNEYYADPTTGDLSTGYTYSGITILETFVFKITGEGDIAFSVYDPYNTKEKAYGAAYYVADSDDTLLNKAYTTYAINTTDSEDGSENPGSRKMTFFGKNVNNSSEEPGCTHSNVTPTAAKDPTCTEAGNSAYWTCNDCGKMFSDKDCTTEITEIPTIDPTGHSLKKTEAKDATCTEAGNSAYWTCSTCGAMFSDAEGTVAISEIPTIPATGHTPVSANNGYAATCTEDGKEADTVCSVCGETLTTGATILATGHNYSMVKTDATCTEASSEVYTCTVCGDTYTTHVDSALGHDFSVVVSSTAGDCQTLGTTTYKCSRCDATNTVEGAYGPHTEVSANNAVAATCTTDGKEADTVCSVCGETITVGATIPATGHTPVSADNGVAATCTTDGKESDTVCSVCGETLTTGAVIPATGHTEVSANNGYAATCTEDGKESDTVCSVCGETLTTGATIPATGHTPGKPVETTIEEPTCTEKGEKNTTVTCTVCGTKLSSVNEELDELGHDYVEGETVPPTFSEDGYTVYTCSRCGAIEKRNIVPALEGVNITVKATDLGTTAINGEDATNGATVKVLKNSKVVLTAAPVEGAEFVGWALNGKIVSSDATYSPVALTDVTYEAVFTETAEATFRVVFVDNYGNVISAQTVADASEIVAPTAPTRPGYTFKGWSVDYTTLTTGATIYAQFEKNAAATYTVTATGCTIKTAAGATATDVMTDVAYDTRVTVTNNGTSAASWKIGDTTVAFGESYTFYVGADVEVVPQFDTAVKAVPTVTAVNVSDVTEAGGLKRAVFLATRSMTDDCELISAGYIYGKAANVTADTTLDDVNGSTVKRIDAKATSEQFSVIYGLRSQTGTVAAKAYVAYVDAEGTTQVIYADLQTYTYA